MQLLTVKQIVTIGNLADRGVRRVLYEAFDYERILAQEERIRASEGVEDKAVYERSQRRGVRIETFAEDRIRYFEQDLSEDFFPQLRDTLPTKAQKLAYLAVKLRYYSRANEVPRALLEVIAPKFFEMYPEGEIWYIELDESTLRKIWADEDLDTHADDWRQMFEEERNLWEHLLATHPDASVEAALAQTRQSQLQLENAIRARFGLGPPLSAEAFESHRRAEQANTPQPPSGCLALLFNLWPTRSS